MPSATPILACNGATWPATTRRHVTRGQVDSQPMVLHFGIGTAVLVPI